MSGYRTWTVSKLKAELVLRGAVLTGRKNDLVDRLIAYDRNHNFKDSVIDIPDSTVIEWPKSGYRQLVKEHQLVFSKITREQIDGYFLYRLAGDKQKTGDIKALEKGKALNMAHKILACSVQVVSPDIFLSGIVGAAMKKQVTYSFKLKLEKLSGTPVNSSCECPAGKGPNGTCKHIAAVLLMLMDFSTTGEVNIEKSCTEGLQTFHKPRTNYNGAPLKIESIHPKRKMSEDILDDPRPQKYRNSSGYNDFVRNQMVNYCSSSSKDLAMRYLHPKADLSAAQKDHDYLGLPYAEYWVDKALQLSDNEAKALEIATRGQASNKKWLQERQWRLTASRFGEISKITLKRNITKLCNSLVNPKPLTTSAVNHGQMYERKALNKFEIEMKMSTNQCGLFVQPNRPFLGASPDATVGDDSVVEVKCPFNGRQENIVPGKLFKFLQYDECHNIILKKSSSYYDQIQGQMLIANKEYCYFVVYTFVDLFIQKIQIDREYCNACLLPKLDLFYTKYLRPYIALTM